MNTFAFKKACELLEASGSSFQDMITPFWSEEQDGVVLPTVGKVIPRKGPRKSMDTWQGAMATAQEAGLTLPNEQEMHVINQYYGKISGLLWEHRGDHLPNNELVWTRVEISRISARCVVIEHGAICEFEKSVSMLVRPLAEFKK